MNKFLIILYVVALFIPPDANADLLCERLKADPSFAESEREYLLNLCDTKLIDHSGPIVFIEGGFLPLPEHFYLTVPDGPEIKMASGQLTKMKTYEDAIKWPYGTIHITQNEVNQPENEQSIELIESAGLSWSSLQCELPITLESFEKAAPGWEFVGQFYRLRIGGTAILLGGGSENLAVTLTETFARLNCDEQARSTHKTDR